MKPKKLKDIGKEEIKNCNLWTSLDSKQLTYSRRVSEKINLYVGKWAREG